MAVRLGKIGRAIPFWHFATVAASGMVAFLAFWEGFFSFFTYRPCTISNPNFVLERNLGASATEFGICLVALLVLFNGAKRLQGNFERAELAYTVVVINLLVSESLLSFIFIRLFLSCAG